MDPGGDLRAGVPLRAANAEGARRVLYVTFDFPPRRTSAVYRIQALSKYLFRRGCQVTVLTTRVGPRDVEDPALLENFPPEIRVVRTPYLPVSGWEEPALPALRNLGALRMEPNRRAVVSRFDASLRWLAGLFRASLYFPDATVGWVPFAFTAALHLHMERPFDAVYTTSPPRSGGLVGLALRRLFRLPWVLEYMDPWYPSPRPWREQFERRLEAAELRCADAVVAVTENHAGELRRNFALPADRVTVIRNGYDEEDFQGKAPAVSVLPAGFLHLTHVGTIYPRFGGCFFDALESLVRDCPDLAQRLRVNIIGYPDDATQHRAQNGTLRGLVQIHGYMRHQDALQAMLASHGLLLFLGDPNFSRLAVSSKIYEYLRAGRPILAVAYPGGVQELIESGRAGWVVPPDDFSAMKSALGELLAAHRDAAVPAFTPREAGFVEQFRYDHLAGRLAEVLNGVVHGRRT